MITFLRMFNSCIVQIKYKKIITTKVIEKIKRTHVKLFGIIRKKL